MLTHIFRMDQPSRPCQCRLTVDAGSRKRLRRYVRFWVPAIGGQATGLGRNRPARRSQNVARNYVRSSCSRRYGPSEALSQENRNSRRIFFRPSKNGLFVENGRRAAPQRNGPCLCRVST
jgi:hypothetical protein